jgi:LysM repeat protein
MEQIDPGRYVLPALVTLLILGAFMIIATSGGSDEPAGAVDRPARSRPATPSRTNTTPAVAVAPAHRFAKVQEGDTPTSMAQRNGISAKRLLELNPSVEPDALKAGQTLKLAP